MPSIPSSRRPGTDTTLGDHEKRIRRLEGNPRPVAFAVFRATIGAPWLSGGIVYHPSGVATANPGDGVRDVFAPQWAKVDHNAMPDAAVVAETTPFGGDTRPDSIVTFGRPGRYILVAGCRWLNGLGTSALTQSYPDFRVLTAWHEDGGVWTADSGISDDFFTIWNDATQIPVPGDSNAFVIGWGVNGQAIAGQPDEEVSAARGSQSYYNVRAGVHDDEGVEFEFRNKSGFTADWVGSLVIVRLG